MRGSASRRGPEAPSRADARKQNHAATVAATGELTEREPVERAPTRPAADREQPTRPPGRTVEHHAYGDPAMGPDGQ
ncbi:hypothetical protein ADK53_20100 [Streptomyces sp. WM6373]|nr:hypothetical protein ADK53_20100 [Streptomyces sp. WM6373]KOU75739.1 hypothetical protein ADK61_14910 [Streptomyces sp. XY66]